MTSKAINMDNIFYNIKAAFCLGSLYWLQEGIPNERIAHPISYQEASLLILVGLGTAVFNRVMNNNISIGNIPTDYLTQIVSSNPTLHLLGRVQVVHNTWKPLIEILCFYGILNKAIQDRTLDRRCARSSLARIGLVTSAFALYHYSPFNPNGTMEALNHLSLGAGLGIVNEYYGLRGTVLAHILYTISIASIKTPL